MKRFRKTLNKLLSLLPYLTVFIFAFFSPTDPDLGWHLKYGEYFFKHGSILRDNTFANLMPDYHWANTSWLTDLISYSTFHLDGFLGLSILSSLVVTLTLFFFSRVARLTLWDQAFLFPIILYLEQPINAISFRGQQFSLLLMGILFYLISFYPKNKKIFLLVIPLFLLWANLHGEFIFGLALFAIWIALYVLVKIFTKTVIPTKVGIQSKRNSLISGSRIKSGMTNVLSAFRSTLKESGLLVGVFILSCLATIINPFGIGIHTAALSHFGSPLLKNISEYLPFDMLSQPWWNQVIVGIGLGMGFIFLFFRGGLSERIPILGVSIVIFILSFSVRRFAWPAYYMILPMLTPLIAFFKPDTKKMTHIMTVVFILIIFVMAFMAKFPFTKYTQFGWDEYCRSYSVGCSPKSAEFLIKHNLTENVFSLYGWGGWLIWNYPQITPVIDGRMHLWKDKEGFSGFTYYYAFEQNFKEIDKSPYNTVYMSPEKPIYKHMEKLVKAGKWKQVYEDDYAGIFIRNKNY